MPYRRWPVSNRRYMQRSPSALIGNDTALAGDTIKVERIPLPNEDETGESIAISRGKVHKPSILDFIRNIGIEEIILIGLIIILLNEGIEDEFILLMLVYILLF